MKLIIIDGNALSYAEMRVLELFDNIGNPVIVVVVDPQGYSKRFLLTEKNAEEFANEIPSNYIIKN